MPIEKKFGTNAVKQIWTIPNFTSVLKLTYYFLDDLMLRC